MGFLIKVPWHQSIKIRYKWEIWKTIWILTKCRQELTVLINCYMVDWSFLWSNYSVALSYNLQEYYPIVVVATRPNSRLRGDTYWVVTHHEMSEENGCYMTPDEFFNYDLDRLDTYSKLRMIVDFVSGMADKYALSLFRKLSGQQL